MKHLGKILSIVIIASTSGCGLQSAWDMSPRHTAASDPRAYCTQLKRQIVYYSFNQNNDAAWSSPAQQAKILQEFRDNHCDDLLKSDPNSDFKPNLPRTLGDPSVQNARESFS